MQQINTDPNVPAPPILTSRDFKIFYPVQIGDVSTQQNPVTPLTNAVTAAVSPIPPARSKPARSAVSPGMRRGTCIPVKVTRVVSKQK